MLACPAPLWPQFSTATNDFLNIIVDIVAEAACDLPQGRMVAVVDHFSVQSHYILAASAHEHALELTNIQQ